MNFTEVMMHNYQCPKCGFHWRQEKRFPHEHCIRCGFSPVPAGEEEMRLAPEPTSRDRPNDRLGLKWRDE